MRLTVHVSGARKSSDQVKTKDGIKTIKRTFNTLSFLDIEESDVDRIIAKLKGGNQGTPESWYTSNEKIAGHSKIK